MNWTIVYVILLLINISGIFHPKNKNRELSIGVTILMVLVGMLIFILK